MEHFNKLTPAEAERLAMLAEECGEVIQIVGKILRHGYESYSPFDEARTPNRELLMKEIADILCVTKLMDDSHDFGTSDLVEIAEAGVEKKLRYTHHQPNSPGFLGRHDNG